MYDPEACGYSMVLDHTNEYIKLRGISVKFAWFQHPLHPPPLILGGTWNI